MDKYPGQLISNLWEFPAIETINRHGKAAFWQAKTGLVRESGDSLKFVKLKAAHFEDSTPIGHADSRCCGWYDVKTWIAGGKVKESTPTIIKAGKNLGKKNATNVFQQALAECFSKYTKQLEKSGIVMIDEIAAIEPMLASVYDRKKMHLSWPVFAQRKLDGHRCIFTMGATGVVAYSRNKKPYLMEHIKRELVPVFDQFPSIYIDGELYTHGTKLQDISSAVRSSKHDQTGIEYTIYDVFGGDIANAPFSERLAILDEIALILGESKKVHIIETFRLADQSEMDEKFSEFIDNGYEGLMIRKNSPYVPSKNGYHCTDLLKVKLTLDAEFKLIGWSISDTGRLAGGIILECITDGGNRFNLNPAMTVDERKRYASEFAKIEKNGKTFFANRFAGHMLNVTFDDYSSDRVPLRARTTLVFRDSDGGAYTIPV
jgi:ATP-dependent DNA ligase